MDIKSLLFKVMVIFLIPLSIYSMEGETIPKILATRDAELLIQKRKKSITPRRPEAIDFDRVYNNLLADYLEYEEDLKNFESLPIPPFGGLNYTMTLEQMKQKITSIVNKMKEEGKILSKEEFEKIKNDYFLLPRIDLTRIWGIEYLKDKINKSKKLQDEYDVPDYVIITEDPNHLTIKLWFGNTVYPLANILENASIYFKKIQGPRIASWNSVEEQDLGVKSGIGYNDFTDPGNIILDNVTGKKYIVDTEFKSFKLPIPPDLVQVLEYAGERFRYLNNVNLSYSFTIDL